MKILPTCFLLSLVSLIPPLQSDGQNKKVEIQIYTAPLTLIEVAYGSEGPLEYGGPSIEYYLKENTSIGLSGSLNSVRNDELSQVVRHPVTENTFGHDYSLIEKNRVLNLYFRKYAERSAGTKVFIGGYVRYWHYSHQRLDTNLYSQEYLDYLIDAGEPTSFVDHKISVGFLAGLKGELSESLFLSLAGGLGGSLPFMYFRNGTSFNEESETVNLKNATTYNDVNHISLLLHLSLGYRF